MNRTIAHRLNPMIGNDTAETLQNLTALLRGHCMLIADRSRGTTLDGEATLYILQTITGALSFEANNSAL
ncbi:hypothetical protein [Chromobacterium subtsugae]|uniref:hypothetical protein n=1 Tax=Chromobacterium subtsugae TaxID=251747 RepID=UPI000A985BB6|nr:hypothetical protein [Chromobacterium subtsugae]